MMHEPGSAFHALRIETDKQSEGEGSTFAELVVHGSCKGSAGPALRVRIL